VLRTPALLPLQGATEHLFFGVDLFFVLSGFLIGGALIDGRGVSDYWRGLVSIACPLACRQTRGRARTAIDVC
jgi:peptidoglycan/LPS O-acetylase OafA/YrhL